LSPRKRENVAAWRPAESGEAGRNTDKYGRSAFGADFLWKFLEIMKHKKKARCTNFVNSWRGNLSERD